MTPSPLAYTFGQGLALATLVVWLLVWALVAWRVTRRTDVGVGGKAVWILVILLAPVLGLFAYVLWDAFRGASRWWATSE